MAIPSGTGGALARQSDGIAAALDRGDRCGAARMADGLVSAARGARVPPAYRSPLLDAARSLAAQIDCPPPPPPPQPAPAPAKHQKHDEPEKPEKHGEHKQKGHG